MSSDLNRFWRNPKLWPEVLPGYYFLADAVQLLGKVRYPISWSGDEPWTRLVEPVPKNQREASSGQVRWAYALIEREMKELNLPTVRPPNARMLTIPVPLTDEEWSAARAASVAIAVPLAEKQARWEDVMKLTCGLLRVGWLHCHVREMAGGDYKGPLDPAKYWNTEPHKIEARFGLCLIDLGNIFGQSNFEPHNKIREISYGRQDYRYMFIEARSLAHSLEAIGKLDPPPEWIADKPAVVLADENAAKAKPRNNAPRTAAGIKAETSCAKWLWAEYISKSPTPTHTKKQLMIEKDQQPWAPDLRSDKAFARSWKAAVALGKGKHDAWLAGGSVAKGQ